jgi:predicted RND superfamily exporter protein
MSPIKKKKKPVIDEVVEAQTANEAINYMFAGLKYFLIHHTLKTLLALLLICGSSLYVVVDYYTSQKTTVKSAEPISQTFSIMPQATAEQQLNPIVINGKTYGYYDPNLEVWKDAHAERFLVHNKQSGQIYWVEVQHLNKSLGY